MQSKAASVKEYLASLPVDRREAIEAVRDMILENLDKGFEEGMQYGMIGYYVPHRLFPDGYHCDPKQPLPFAGLASQKNHMSLHIMSLYSNADEESAFREQWAKTGRKLDMGKCCIRFKRLEDFAMDVVRSVFRKTTAKKYIQFYLKALEGRSTPKKGSMPSAKPTPKGTRSSSVAKGANRTKSATKVKGGDTRTMRNKKA
jgi:Domain of unknown function (DU1801)